MATDFPGQSPTRWGNQLNGNLEDQLDKYGNDSNP